MYIRQKNLEMKTRLERLKEKREFFCKNILPDLNKNKKLLNSKKQTNITISNLVSSYLSLLSKMI